MRLPYTDELFQWKQADDEANGIGTYPFENAEARFAIGVFRRGDEQFRAAAADVDLGCTGSFERIARDPDGNRPFVQDGRDLGKLGARKGRKANQPGGKRLYLTSCWLETLCTAEARVLGGSTRKSTETYADD